MDTILKDVRFAIRSSIKNWGLTIVIILTLAIGIGATVALFTIVNAVVLQPLAYKNSDQLVRVYESNIRKISATFSVSPPNYKDWKKQNRAFSDMAALSRTENYNLLLESAPEQATVTQVSSNLFSLLGTEPIVGRDFVSDDELLSKEPVVMLSHNIWNQRFGKDKNIIGRSLTLNSQSYTIVGVMPAGFELPFNVAQLYIPLRFSVKDEIRARRYLRVIGRLKDGVSSSDAQIDLGTIAKSIERQYPESNTGWGVVIRDLKTVVVPDDFRGSLILLLGAVGMVLLIACVNVASLLSAKASSRQKEIAIRTALGTTRFKLIRQLLTESVVIAIPGGILGLIVAYFGIGLLTSINPEDIPRLKEITFSWQVLGVTFILSLLTAAIFGIIPAIQASKPDLTSVIKDAAKGGATNNSSRYALNTLVVIEVALGLVVVISAGLLVKSFQKLQRIDAGFNPSQVITATIDLPESKFLNPEATESFFKQLTAKLLSFPGVTSIGRINILPMGGGNSMNAFSIVGRPQKPGEVEAASYRVVTASYFQTMNIQRVKGRYFYDYESKDSSRVMLIDESAAHQYWPSEDPIGKFIKFGKPTDEPYMVVGIVKDVKKDGLDSEALPTLYLLSSQAPPQPSVSLVIRTKNDPLVLAPAIRNEVWSLDKEQTVARIETMEKLLSTSLSRWRLNLVIFTTFAVIAILLTTIGLYSVISFSVGQRVHEIGVRMALGADQWALIFMILKHGLILTLIGIGIGITASFALTRIMTNMLFDVSPTDITIFLTVSLFLLLIDQVACFIPARRAIKVDPLIAIRGIK